jgi:predicted metal-dependent HD superfamily phosphohydrolase
VGRAKVLRQLTEKPRIYITALFFEHFEQQARKNTEREIGLLESLQVI